ncbi:hypothetical protein Tco_0474054, partial [Tanacetum coccineum]
TVMSSDSASSEEPEAAPESMDYVPGPEEPEQAPLSPDYVLGPEHPEYLAPSDEEVPMEDQPYAVVDSPIALSLGYVADSDPEEDPEEDSGDGPVDYPAVGGDNDDDDSSDDDEDEEAFKEEEVSKEEAEEEEEEHLALADSVVTPVADHVPSFEETELFETDESAATLPSPPACHTTARISIRPEAPMLLPLEEEVERLLALLTPPPSPLILLSPPSAEERLARCLAAPALPSLPLPPLPSSPLPPLPDSLFIPPVDHREDILEAELPPHKMLCLTTLVSRYEVGESSTAVLRTTRGHKTAEEVAPVILKGVNTRVTEFAAVQEQDTQDIYDDHRMDVHDSLIAALTAQVSSLQGHLATALGEIRALQAREQARADVPEGTDSSS